MTEKKTLQVVVIGGGAAGFFAAVTCAASHRHTQVTLIEAGRKPLAKVRISGGGRCNVTHHCFDPALLIQNYPRGGKALRGAFFRFQPQDTVAWFTKQGVALKTEADGRMFPVTNSSETIVDCLTQAALKTGVKLWTSSGVRTVQKLPKVFKLGLKDGRELNCDRLLLATGSNPTGYAWARELGHKIIPPVPSLFTFKLKDPRFQDLAGTSVAETSVRLQFPGLNKELPPVQTGPLLITHWGVSGPAILKLSAWGARVLSDHNYQMSLIINWLPQFKQESLREQLLAVKSQFPKRKVITNCPFDLPKRLWQRLVIAAGIPEAKPWAELSKKALNKLVQELNAGEYKIKGKGTFKEEFVTCGGVDLKEIHFKTMGSKLCPGLHFAGEILDIDGVTGGFNFQSAWTTGWLAGNALGKK
ncbi:MAG: NAD(P)/FAD-dependent oxidoreductase [Spirulinaceae cyanobacterium]